LVESLAECSKRKKQKSYLKEGEKETVDEKRTKKTKAGVAGRDQEAPNTGAEICSSPGPDSQGQFCQGHPGAMPSSCSYPVLHL